MKSDRLVVRPAIALFSLGIVFFALILVNGYASNLLGLAANAWVIGALIIAELGLLARWLVKSSLGVMGDPFELAGFLLITVYTWIYFLLPSLPTLLPPTYSGDAANHLAFANSIYSTEHIISDYPGGAALTMATMAHWVGVLPFRIEHPLAALWIALMAGGIYLLACSMLPARREYKTLALFSAFALFIPWEYFGGMLIQYGYFLTQLGAQLFIVAFVCFLVEYLDSRHSVWLIGMAACLVSISVLFQLWLMAPVALFVIAVAREWRRITSLRQPLALLIVPGALVLFWLAILFFGRQFIPNPSRFGATGAVPSFSLDSVIPILILAVLGILLAKRSGYRVWLVGIFLAVGVLQSVLLFVVRWFGSSDYWFNKSMSLPILPLALFAVIPLARGMEWLQRKSRRNPLATIPGFAVVLIVLVGGVSWLLAPPSVSILNETDIQAALWAKENLNTRHIHYISRKDLVAQWLAIGFWDETLPDDLLVDLAVLGPKTFEAWRDDSAWGEYLFISSGQHMLLDSSVRTIYQNGDTTIVQKQVDRLPPIDQNVAAHFGQVLALGDYELSSRSVRAGDVITLTAQIETDQVPLHQVVWRLQLRDLQNYAIAETRPAPFDAKFPLQRWPDKIVLTQVITLSVPMDARPGLTDLQLGLYYVGNGEALTVQSPDGTQDDVARLGRIKILLPTVTTHELASIRRLNDKVGASFQLLGYRAWQMSGDSIKVVLYWQSTSRTPDDYTVFVHLVDGSGALRAQQDSVPRGGTYPTSIWEPGEIIVDSYTLSIPQDAASANYQIEVGMYSLPDIQRLTISNAEGDILGDHVDMPINIQAVKN